MLHLGASPFSTAMLARLRAAFGEELVGDNQPYSMDGTDFTIPHHADARGLDYLELEVRQDTIATPEQQKQYMALFYDLLAAQISGHLGEYKGVRVTMGLARKFEDTEIVITTVERPSNPATRVDWVVSTSSGTPQIVDLIAEGTSMRITQASDFTAFLAHHQYNVEDLIAAMRQKSAQNG